MGTLIRESDVEVINKIALNPIGNFLVQDMIGVNGNTDTFVDRMQMSTIKNYGCRVVQTLLEQCEVQRVHMLVDAMLPFVAETAINPHSTHFVHCLCKNHDSTLFGKVFAKISVSVKLCMIAKDQYECRVLQRILEASSQEITTTYVSQVLQTLLFQLLTHAQRSAVDKYANYSNEFLITEPPFARQRDYIIDQVVVESILGLSQGKFGSHVVEASLAAASSPYLHELCEEIFYNYQILPKQRTPLEIMNFDQYGNNVVQRFLTVAVDVAAGRRPGDPKWLTSLAETVERNRAVLQRYSSGMTITNTLSIPCPTFHK